MFVNTRQHGRAGRPPAGRAARRRGRSGGRPPRVAVPRTAGSGSRPGCGPGTCGPWWPPPRSSSASTSGRSSWCARSARRAASPPSCSGSAAPTTPAPGRRPGGCTRPPGTSWSSAPRCCAARAGPARRHRHPGTAARHPGPADGGRVGRRSRGREDELFGLVRRAAPYRDLSAEDFEDVADLLAEGIAHRPRPARLLPAPRPGQRHGQGPPRRPAGRADLGRRHPRARRLPGRGRARRRVQIGTVNEDWAIESMAGRRLPARHPLLADPPGRAGHGPGDRRARRAAVGAVLAGRGARADPGAVRGGLGAAAAPSRTGEPAEARRLARARSAGSAGPRPSTIVAYLRGRAGRARRAAHHGRHRPRALLRRGRRHAAGRARAVRRAGEPGVRPGAAQAVLRHVRLRAAGGGQRRRHPAVARAAAQLPARAGAEVPAPPRPWSRWSGRPC